MNMTIVYVLFILTTAIVISFSIRYPLIKQNIFFFLLALNQFIFELVLLITASYKLNNHVIANVYTVIYYPLAVFLLFHIWESIKGKSGVIRTGRLALCAIIIVSWGIENFVVHNVGTYNTILATISSLMLVVISIYLINVLLFVKSNSIIKDSDGLLLIAILIRSFFSGLILFMNYRLDYSTDFYKNISMLVNIALVISNVFLLFSIICLPKSRKYTWPF